MKHTILSIFLSLFICQLYAQLPEGFSDEAISGPWDLAVGVAFDATGNGYIWTSTGKLYFMDTLEQVHPIPLLDISEEVGRWLDHGMLSLVLDPNFIQNGKIYLLYCVDTHYLHAYGTADYDPLLTVTHQATIGRLTRYTLDLSQAIPMEMPESRKVLIGKGTTDGFPILSDSHGIGGLAFGTDGSLLASCGDSGSSNSVDNGFNPTTDYVEALEKDIIENYENVGSFKSQVLNNLNGKLIRIDPETGYGLSTNPFYDPAAPETDNPGISSLAM